MLPSLQPSRPKLPQHTTQPTHQQRRSTHELPRPQESSQQQPSYSPPNSQRPWSQIEAMPPARTAPSFPTHSFYDAATRHPVFFTNNLRKPPFPIPQMPSQGWNPVANGYIQEREKATGGSGTKL
ncbi:hypothetical protein BU25DRAFT_428973 [Macroventuria anomochaeta]|uniref:Uncharacterized protein n=1 Tax=Macroventuria anomochaeta TaxID=301207 RepID=A0ACB6SAM7_9PLEO|nr:uncharacterized protein BU25DRAFT_428973 [Macroventuria anomochaeta]KAF2631276.1 hypothetical protein BU25DRAFT_428973 [Macroventuria anomochaeta]